MKITKTKLKQIIKEELAMAKLKRERSPDRISQSQLGAELGKERSVGAQGVADEEKKLLIDLYRALKTAALKDNLFTGDLAMFIKRLQVVLTKKGYMQDAAPKKKPNPGM